MIRADGTSDLPVPGRSESGTGGRPAAGLLFTGEMYAVQLDQLAAVLAASQRGASATAGRWVAAGLAESERLSPGPRWVWLTRAGLATCGLPYAASRPGLSRLAHLRAVSGVRLALAANPVYAAAGAYWRSERRLRARIGGRLGLREHVPDAEVHWPDGAPVGWAGECWAIEAELTPKTVARTVTIMRELLTRTGDYGCPAADAHVPGRPVRHSRAIYLCSPAARPVVARARDSLGSLAARVEIRCLPDSAALPALPVRTRPAGRAGPERRTGPERPAADEPPASSPAAAMPPASVRTSGVTSGKASGPPGEVSATRPGGPESGQARTRGTART
ncbi:MAG TPA: hypothetical protein VN840_21640 [Streptosporangiaceae bacterium]|nr:hypothetical protein [Streptosporangiaceae bacterium]